MTKPVLAVQPNTDASETSWITSVDGQMSSSVGSLSEAMDRARRQNYALDVPDAAYEQMVEHGVAPKNKPYSYRELLPRSGE
ncbi:MAG: hypothetical protein ACJ73J_04535 [Actinomycetes bacterium]